MKLIKIKIKCPNCFKILRVPINRGKILINCPHCLNKFIFDPGFKAVVKKTIQSVKKFLDKFDKYSFINLKNPFIKGIVIYLMIILFLLIFSVPCYKSGKSKEHKKYNYSEDISI